MHKELKRIISTTATFDIGALLVAGDLMGVLGLGTGGSLLAVIDVFTEIGGAWGIASAPVDISAPEFSSEKMEDGQFKL
ncbi:hypothetical protein F5Y12DRAFT_718547 [Xylaria sp. FL1777]|nr:hypothetical protein F5Y12DRAFT_718547 [Xylaria sp. FL1777]